jgi:hypothetical protein
MNEREAAEIRDAMRAHMVQLKGNDVLVYGYPHVKLLPERSEPAYTGAPHERLELHIAFGPPPPPPDEPGRVGILVDNGQPRTIPRDRIYPWSKDRPASAPPSQEPPASPPET